MDGRVVVAGDGGAGAVEVHGSSEEGFEGRGGMSSGGVEDRIAFAMHGEGRVRRSALVLLRGWTADASSTSCLQGRVDVEVGDGG